ncbi:MAG: C40 family peptidase [Treponema sp.]|jgi:probable lipoprotein NlpC|nr:C40 family peptidase [Treponema sp.]
MRFLFSSMLMFFACGFLVAAPLETGFLLAPEISVSQEEKDRAFLDARNRVINAAVKYENTPYRYGGITPKGLDCSGLIYLSFKDALGVSLPRSASGLYSWVEKISFEKAQPGDFLFFRTGKSNSITHVALYLGGRRFIHSASTGSRTGVIYTTLDEGSWSRTFAGAGRAFPEANPQTSRNSTENNLSPEKSSKSSNRFLFGAAFAPTWSGFLKEENLLRGFTSQFRLAADFVPRMIFGLELRPEYDRALGVFRLPLTLSLGPNDKFRIFAGPVLSIGDTSLSTEEGDRYYSGGTSWLGTIGLTAAPLILKTSKGEFAPYIEAAWQSYFSENSNSNLNADISAGLRLSTGIRWTLQFK